MEDWPSKRQRVSYPIQLEVEGYGSKVFHIIRNRTEHVAVQLGKPVECANTLQIDDFRNVYLPESLEPGFSSQSLNGLHGIITCPDGQDFQMIVNGCFDLVERTSKDDYANSEVKWSAYKKKKEMRLPDLKYFILKSKLNSPEVDGFISFMATYEDGHAVLYIYEIHLKLEYQGRGLGRKLMEIAERVGRNIGLDKVMLTVFRTNTRAMATYEKLGYAIDKYSPQPKILRNGTMKESGYVILSKSLKEEKDAEKL